jgi:drug/metabolite transporter (DMT)-like permease
MLIKLLIIVVTVNTVVSQLLLKRAMSSIGSVGSFNEFPKFLLSAAMSPWVYGSLALQISGYILWMIIISKEKLGIAVALSGSGFYLLITLLAWLLFDERLATLQWVGIGFITLGVLCISARPG